MSQLRPLLLLLFLLGCGGGNDHPRLEPFAVVKHPPLKEASALLPSRLHAGIYWTLNDSGHAPHLFAIDAAGKLRGEFRVRGLNTDWEALACDDAGHLYIGDVGNNGGLLSRRWVYQLKEPTTLPESRRAGSEQPLPEISLVQTFPYTFPKKPFDVEAMFYWPPLTPALSPGGEREKAKGSLYLISKVTKKPALYRLPLDRPGQAVTLELVSPLPDELVLVTDAALSPDGKRLAVASYDYAAWIELQADGSLARLEECRPTVVKFKQRLIEGCCWDGAGRDDLLLISEGAELFRLPVRVPK